MRLQGRGLLAAGVVIAAILVGAMAGGSALARSGGSLPPRPVAGFNQPMYVAFAPGDTQHMWVLERSGVVKVVNRDGTQKRDRPGHLEPGYDRRRQRADGDRVPAQLPAVAPLLPRLQRQRITTSSSTSSARQRPTPTRQRPARAGRSSASYIGTTRTTTGGRSCSAPADTSTSAPATAAAATTPGQRAPPQQPARQDSENRSVAGQRPASTRSRPRTRSSAKTPRPRSTPTAFATPSGSASTPRPAGSRSATSGRTPTRRWTTRPSPRRQGANFGWPEFEGFHSFDPGRPGLGTPVDPVLEYPHSDPGGGAPFGCAVIGGDVVRSPDLPSLAGQYVYTDNCTGEIRAFKPRLTGAVAEHDLGLNAVAPSAFGVGPQRADLRRLPGRHRVPPGREAVSQEGTSPPPGGSRR